MKLYNDKSFLESVEFPFHIMQRKICPEMVFEAHFHEFIELVYIIEGRGTHFYQGNSFSVSQGDVFIIEPGVTHSYQVDSDSKHLRIYNVMFQPRILSKELEALSNVTPFIDFFYVEPFFRKTADFQSHMTLNATQQIELTLLLDRIYEEYQQKPLGYHFMIQTKLIEMFIYLSRWYDHSAMKPMVASNGEQMIMQRVCKYIKKHYAQPLTLQQVSQLCGMSLSTFTAKFKEYSGETFLEYRNHIRMKVAKELLASTNLKIITISQDVGFEDISNFYKNFKRLERISPREYRKSVHLDDTFSA